MLANLLKRCGPAMREPDDKRGDAGSTESRRADVTWETSTAGKWGCMTDDRTIGSNAKGNSTTLCFGH